MDTDMDLGMGFFHSTTTLATVFTPLTAISPFTTTLTLTLTITLMSIIILITTYTPTPTLRVKPRLKPRHSPTLNPTPTRHPYTTAILATAKAKGMCKGY
ncbi:hypothetical protein BU24DRAFT_417983 [Aaosphaeria arxii CBS 175.79]|uniref:Uncharacterized protein n=1 Tax=Aaosphaeria arxii CBS 175.79 TaxID=1450172 RepID=A0A6A5YCB0_9PLEO|nr:uncharacterized protein BU24DRAFT_417983 [Aaosphaeria arxii CBS 175.79]KAF2022330.1 hypothetical protein BU24DRAFT_417983 [Aaosphaeria arxii CBS 175.79]